ncbi:hypothetical protein HK097_000104 [Rhizophlyctis rosea]|uniref:Uncharacterized protein n=1 Tax=Rhizophlyctis rosea TaxID=64517 RepID=A0AAD5X298_9FUNG|nr:hypothetical protein HK097_000104 [Rhizophlyctis rosea]
MSSQGNKNLRASTGHAQAAASHTQAAVSQAAQAATAAATGAAQKTKETAQAAAIGTFDTVHDVKGSFQQGAHTSAEGHSHGENATIAEKTACLACKAAAAAGSVTNQGIAAAQQATDAAKGTAVEAGQIASDTAGAAVEGAKKANAEKSKEYEHSFQHGKARGEQNVAFVADKVSGAVGMVTDAVGGAVGTVVGTTVNTAKNVLSFGVSTASSAASATASAADAAAVKSASTAREGVSGGAVGWMAGAGGEDVSVTAVPLQAQPVERETITKEKPVGQAVPVKKV